MLVGTRVNVADECVIGSRECEQSVQSRVTQGQPLPQVTLMRVTGADKRTKERRRKRRGLVGFFLGMEGGRKGEGMPRDVFLVVLEFLMPSWDPLRRKDAGAAPPPLQQG